MDEWGYGGARCPWLVSVGKGQLINFTLHDFGVEIRRDDMQPQVSSLPNHQRRTSRNLIQQTTACQVYATLRDLEARVVTSIASTVTEVTTCGLKERTRHVMLSEGSKVEVIMMSLNFKEELAHFALQYEGWFVISMI